MVTVCQKCGDRGFPETLNYCVKCGETAEHTYCLDKLPNFLNEGVPWTCEDCTIRVEGESAPDNPSPASVVNSKCMDMRSQQAQCSRRRKRKRYITYSTFRKKKRRHQTKSSLLPDEAHK